MRIQIELNALILDNNYRLDYKPILLLNISNVIRDYSFNFEL